jgi:hypothetical protein
MADIYHESLTGVPLVLQPIFGNSLVLGTMCAVILNLILRIGVEIEASFDEFNLDLRVRYIGDSLILSERRPTPREIIATEDGERLLAGYLLRRSADRIASRSTGRSVEVALHYAH